MNYWQVLFNADFLFPVVLVAILQSLVLWQLDSIDRKINHVVVSHVILVYLGRPFFLALLVVLFVVLAYPTQFGLEYAPEFLVLLKTGGKDLSNLINLAVVLGVILPIIPILGRYHGPVTAVQIMIVSAVILNWLVSAKQFYGVIQFFPDSMLLLQLLVMSVLLYRLSIVLSSAVGDLLDQIFNTDGMGIWLGPAFSFLFQTPVILFYTLFLGNQIQYMDSLS